MTPQQKYYLVAARRNTIKADSGEALPVLASIAFVLAASAVLPGIGTIAAIILLNRIHANGQREKLRALEATDKGIIAPYLPKDELEKYQREFGKEQVEREMATAEELDALPTAIIRQRQKEARKKTVTPNQVLKRVDPLAPVESPGRLTESSLGVISRNPRSTLFIGPSGAGKDVILSNAVKGAKKANPHLFVYAIDPKDDSGERGFWEDEAFDTVRHVNPKQDAGRFCREIIGHLQEVQKMLDADRSVLLIFDECVLVSSCIKAGSDWGKELSLLLGQMMDWFVSGGNSQRCYVWMVSQVPQDRALPIESFNRNQLRIVMLLRVWSDIEKLNASNPPLVPKELCRKEILEDAIDASHKIMLEGGCPPKSGRAIYLSDFSCWMPMIPLPVLSATDRDAGVWFSSKDKKSSKSIQSIERQSYVEEVEEKTTFDKLEESPFPEFEIQEFDPPHDKEEEISAPVLDSGAVVEPALSSDDFVVPFSAIKEAIKKLDREWVTAAQIQDKTNRVAQMKPDGTKVSRPDFRQALETYVNDGLLVSRQTAKTSWYGLG